MLEPEYVMQLNNVLHRAGKHLNMSASYDYGAPKHPTAPYDTPRSTFGVTAFYTPPHNSGGVLWFHVGRPCICPSVRQSYVHPSIRFSFPDDNNSGGVLWFHVGRPCICPSVCQSYVRPSVFRFRMITWVNINWFSPNLVCALILWISGSGLLMGQFRQMFTELSAKDMPILSFPDDNLSK